MVARKEHLASVRSLLREFPVVGLIGARQVGKSTLARSLARSIPGTMLLDLEDPSIARASRIRCWHLSLPADW